MRYGKQIGNKFDTDGKALRYPGNTVLADLPLGSAVHACLCAVRESLLTPDFAPLFIPLPKDSYHMTVIRGLNDRVRTDGFWPAPLDRRATIEAMDRYVAEAVASAPNPGPIRMVIAGIRFDDEDLRVLLRPTDDGQQAALRAYRDRVADALSLRLPGHSEYTYHITLAYTLRVPEGERRESLNAWLQEAESQLANAAPFATCAPYMAYYEDMMRFLPARNRAVK